ncbi:MAG: 7-carboxy-7-deazaguanine synthase QueE [Balneolaceae bacterium]
MFNNERQNSTVEPGRDIESPRDFKYPLMEDFHTIQGEGIYAGRSAYFIRLAGCDVGCWWCDVKESWDEESHPLVRTGEIVDRVISSGTGLVVITGGEPLLHDLNPLTGELKRHGLRIHIETSGSSPLSGSLDWITLSPKRFKKPLQEIYSVADELKIIVLKKKDLEWAEACAAKCPEFTELLLQPEWETPSSIELIVDYVKRNPAWRISLQTHKFLNVP